MQGPKGQVAWGGHMMGGGAGCTAGAGEDWLILPVRHLLSAFALTPREDGTFFFFKLL